MRSRSPLALALSLALGGAAPGCYFSNIQNDVDRTPEMDAGVGAAILMPGESAPMREPGAGAPGSAGPQLSSLGGTRVDEESHLSAREEPVWWKYLTLPFAVIAAPFKLAADSTSEPTEAGPAVPEPAPKAAAPEPVAPRVDYETARLQQLERELDQRAAPEAAPAPEPSAAASTRASAGGSIEEELAALQRVPRSGASATPPALPDPRAPHPAGLPAPPRAQASLVPAAAADGIVDRNGDGRVDLWIYREDGEIVRRVVDDDFDGRADRTFVYDRATRALVRVEEDTDQDGRTDAWTDYQDGEIQRRRADADHDGAVDTWTLYRDGKTLRHEQDANGDGFRDRVGFYRDGRLERDEVDTNADGRPDVFNQYDDREQVVRRDEDTDFDGKVDRISYFESGRLARREIIDPGSR